MEDQPWTAVSSVEGLTQGKADTINNRVPSRCPSNGAMVPSQQTETREKAGYESKYSNAKGEKGSAQEVSREGMNGEQEGDESE